MKNKLFITSLLLQAAFINCSTLQSIASSKAASSTSTPRTTCSVQTTACKFDLTNPDETVMVNNDGRELLFALQQQPPFNWRELRRAPNQRRAQQHQALAHLLPPPLLRIAPRNIADQPIPHLFSSTQSHPRNRRSLQNSPLSQGTSPLERTTFPQAPRVATPAQQPGSPSYAEMVRRRLAQDNR